jgi:hypothetical protein
MDGSDRLELSVSYFDFLQISGGVRMEGSRIFFFCKF